MFLPPTPNHLLPISGLPRIVPRARTGVSSTGAPKRYILGSDDIGFMASDGLGRAGGYSLLLSGISLQTSITADFSVRSRWPLPGTLLHLGAAAKDAAPTVEPLFLGLAPRLRAGLVAQRMAQGKSG